MRLIKLLFCSIVLFGSVKNLRAQGSEAGSGTVQITVPEVAIMDIESGSGNAISLVLNAPSEAGERLDMSNAVDSSLWINYSSVRSQGNDSKRTISAKIVSGSVPTGFRLRVKPLEYTGSGDGDLGKPQNSKGRVLKNYDRAVIKNIKTCFTGDGAGNGHQLVYSLELRNNKYEEIDFNSSSVVTVLYTISDN